MQVTYYDILEIPYNATPADIKEAYRRLAKLYHPDINKNPEHARYFVHINDAYNILIDEQKRALYDLKLVYAMSQGQPAEPAQQPGHTPKASPTTSRRRARTAYTSAQQQRRKAATPPTVNLPDAWYAIGQTLSKVCLLFAMVLIVDFLIPARNYEEHVLAKKEYITARHSQAHYINDVVITESAKLPIAEKEGQALQISDAITVKRSRILAVIKKVTRRENGKQVKIGPHYSLYSVFIFFPILFIGFTVANEVFIHHKELKFKFVIVQLLLLFTILGILVIG